ncbi:anti-sigma regulatory factor [Peribacillus cavernae]|uniref:Anti-sigma regulatory factor n=1 Tax=Peribacillus cavernae TaxID=1674310 RepID=A0A433HS36_9BACI|nr:anti-sigma regulatory factor [Peribacillus cavernae]MDQ0218838.1 serine/threonine-protein kinase RsbT [Peribacillus cavernae]RUQ31043.1 anti-sigma regulatory factor [Peribacillus cavernae]
MKTTNEVSIKNEWDIVAARQAGREAAKRLEFGIVDQSRITTAISELARNIYLYALPGKIVIEEIHKNNRNGLRIVAKDKGPGIEDIRKALEDGYTTSGGLGAGVPGVKRLMDEFEIDSAIGVGTEVTAVKWLK